MNRQFTINDVFMPGITGGEPDRVRQAFHAPDLLSGSEIGQRDNAAEQLGMSYGEADAGWEDASTELKIRKAETVPGADRWVQDAPENVTFLQEDADGLMAVYQSLHDSGFLSQDDLDEGTAQEIAQGGNGIVDTLERARLANERTDLGAAVLSGAMEPEEARAKLSSIDSRMAALAKRRGDVSGFYSFMEQGYRMVSRDLSQAGYRSLESGLTGASAGAIAGTIAGSAVPVVGNLTGAVGGSVAGGIAGVGAGLARGMYESAQHMEEANFLADLLNEKDDAGNYLDVDEIREKAQLYGMGSALVEMAGDALSAGAAKLIAPFLKTAAANLGGKSLQLFTKDAIKSAIKNKQAWPVMRRFLLGMGAGAAAEGAEEAVQEGVSASIEAWLKNSLNEEGKAYFRDEQEGLFSAETWAAMAESGLEGAKVGAWFVLLPGIAQLFVDAGKVSRAREFAQGVKDVGAVVANSATAQMAPARMDTFLQAQGLHQTVYIPADAAWQMQTQGTDLVAALGWTQESLEEAASLGHDIAVPLSRLVSRLDTGTLNAVADIMREGPNAMNVFEAEEPNSFLQEDVDAISAAAEEWEFEQDMLDAELDRVRSAITEAVRSVPGLLQQIVGSADTETSVSTYVDTIVTLIEQAAQRLRVYGDDVGSIIQKLNFEGLIRGADGRRHTAEEIEQMVAEEAQAEADRPFWDNVWGRLDADSLKRDFPDARRELAKKHGYGLFSRKGEGLAVDELADILKNAGWLEQDADSSTLVEMLKSKKRPKARKAGKAEPALRQNVAANSHGVPMERVTVFDRAFSRKEMDEALAALAGQNLENKLEGLYAQVNLVQRKKLRSAKAIDKSIDNGFGGGVHLSFAAKIKNLWTWAARATLDENAPVQRFVAPIRIGDEDNFAWLTVKKSDEGLRIYSLELMDKEKLARTSQRVSTEEPKALPLASFEEIIERMGRPVNDESPLFQFIGEAGAARLDEAEEANVRMDNLAVAREMESAGKDAAAIKMATGWERGADGKWRYEVMEAPSAFDMIGDAKKLKSLRAKTKRELKKAEQALEGVSKQEPRWDDLFMALLEARDRVRIADEWNALAKHMYSGMGSRSFTLRELVPDTDLFVAYPDLQFLRVEVSPGDRGIGALATRGDELGYISLNLNTTIGASKLLYHEIQHAIQHIEGFAPGGSLADVVGSINKEGRTDAEVYEEAHARYRRLAGEVEAYNVMRRMDMTHEERMASLASQTEDVAREDQIFLERGRQALMAMQAANSQSYKTAEIQSLDDGDFLIRLFRGANLSTLAHEISHAVHLEMERLDSAGKGTDALKRDLDTLRRWQSKFDDEAALRTEYDRYYKGLYGVEFDDLDAVGKLAVKQRAQREMVARGFELYLREGEAPTPGMEAVFRRMGKWMKRVYASASQLNVEISDDVREVFDRWLASEEDIAAAAAANDIHGFTAPLLDSLGLQGADRLELEGMISDALGKASDALRRDRARYRRDHVQQWRDEVEQELAADPVYQARAAMRRTPIDLDAVVDTYGQELADALRAKLPATMKKGGDNPELLAFDYGFENAGQMINAILNRPGTQERRKELLAQKMQDADAQFAAEDYLFEQEELRQREDKVGEALYRLELNSKTAMGRPVSPSQQEFEDFGSAEKNRWKIAREQLRTLVSNLLDEKEAQAAIQPDSYRRAAAKAMREERKAILAKDWAEAVKQNYLARVNMEAAYQAGKRRDRVNKLRRQAKRFLDSATPDTRARFAVFGLSQKVSLFDPTMKMVQNAADKSLDDVREFLEKMKEEGFYTVDAQIPEELFEGQKQSWKLMDWKDLQPYLEGMAVLMHMERESRKANSEAAKQAWREEMDAMAEGILALNPHRNPHADQKKRLDILRFLKEVHASHLKAETIALLLDGDQDMGPVWRAVIAPINRAQADRDRRMKQARDEVKKLFSVYEPSEWVDIRGKRIFVPGLGRGLTKEQMLAVMLNAGNESNLERLRGMGYKDNEIRAIIDMLDERDVRFVQSVWDYLETFRKESFDLEERLSGVRPQAIEATPLQTRFGELRGGYYPVSYDPQESSKPIDAESLGTLTGSMMPAVDHGSMKQRTATGLGTPLKLTLEVVPNHVAKTLHMLAFREPVRQVARVLNDKAVNAAIESTMGVEISKALKDWLHYVAGERPGVNGWSKALSMLRKNSALYSMGVKLTTILAQFTGLLASTAEIGPRWVAAGLVRTYCRQNPFTVYRETAALSPMMENRMRSVDRDLYEMSTGLMAKGSSNKVLDKFVKFQHLQEQYAFLPVGFVQMAFADLPTWQGAYAKAIHEGKSQSEAIEYADAIVTRTQVGGADKDLAGVQTGQELGKIMTQFYSYFSALYQLYARRMTMLKRSGYSKEAWARLATLFLLTGVAEPILSALFTRDTPEDDEDWAAWAAQKVFFNPWNMIVGVRDVFNLVESSVDGFGGRSRATSLLTDILETGERFRQQLMKGEDMDPRAALKAGWKNVGLLTGIVNAQELLALEAFWDWLEDSNPDFELADLIRRKKK